MACPCLANFTYTLSTLGDVSDLFRTSWIALTNLINNYKSGAINWDQLQAGLSEIYTATWDVLPSEEIVMLRIAVAEYLESNNIAATVTRTKAREYATKWGLNFDTLQTRVRQEIASLNTGTKTIPASTTLTTVSTSTGIYWVIGLSLGAVGLYFLVNYLSKRNKK
ncbi:MAG: hypothetical protein WC428_05800 [Candidatus Paceibacterota bacterium]|jgi:hypothetical protein